MVAYTPNYDLALPTVGADRNIWGGELNGNTSFFDTFLRSFQNTFIGNTEPDTFQTGTFWINNTVTDPVTPWTYSVYDGTQWVMVGMIDPVLHKFIPSNATFQLNVVTISNSGTYTPSPGLIYCIA